MEERQSAVWTAECYDVAKSLDKVMNIGSRLSVVDVHMVITTDPQFAHLFNRYGSARASEARIIRAIKTNPRIGNKIFNYLYLPEERTKHWVQCIEKEFKDFLL